MPTRLLATAAQALIGWRSRLSIVESLLIYRIRERLCARLASLTCRSSLSGTEQTPAKQMLQARLVDRPSRHQLQMLDAAMYVHLRMPHPPRPATCVGYRLEDLQVEPAAHPRALAPRHPKAGHAPNVRSATMHLAASALPAEVLALALDQEPAPAPAEEVVPLPALCLACGW